MAKPSHRLLSRTILANDQDTVVGLASLLDYQPSNPALRAEALQALLAERTAKEDAYTRALNACRAAAAARREAQVALHRRVLQARGAVTAHYGLDADEVMAVGLKKKSAHRRRSLQGLVAVTEEAPVSARGPGPTGQ